MKKKGLELFEGSNGSERKRLTEPFEGLVVPSLFLLFISIYKLGVEGFLNAKRDFEGYSMSLTNIIYKNDLLSQDLCISHFYNFLEIETRWAEDIKYSSLYHEHNLLPIAYNEANLDHVYIEIKGEGGVFYIENEKIIKLEDDIFDFCKNIVESDILDEDYKGQVIYKVWGDRHWYFKSQNFG